MTKINSIKSGFFVVVGVALITVTKIIRMNIYPARTCASRGYVIGDGVHYIGMFVDKNFFLNHTLVIDSPFQTFAVGLLVKFID